MHPMFVMLFIETDAYDLLTEERDRKRRASAARRGCHGVALAYRDDALNLVDQVVLALLTGVAAAAAVGQAGDECGRPQRPRPGHGHAELSRGEIEHGTLVPWRRAAHLPDMLIDIERRIIGPVRPPASRRRPVKPLPEPRHRADPLAEHAPRLSDGKRRGRAEQQDGPDVPGRSSVARRELHQVCGASPVRGGRHRQFTAG